MNKSFLTSLALSFVSAISFGQEQQIRKLTLQELKAALEQPLPENCKAGAEFNKQTGALELSFKKDSTSLSFSVETTPPVYAFLAQDKNEVWYNLYQYSKENNGKRTDLFIQSELYGKRTVGLRAEILEKRGSDWVPTSLVDCSKK